MKSVFLCFMSLVLVSCASDDSPTNAVVGSSANSAQEITDDSYSLAGIKALVAKKTCQQTSDCGIIGVGARPCGGPDEYLVYSKTAIDERKLQQYAEKFNALKVKSNQEKGVVGICVVATKPQVSCESNQCVDGSSNISL